jgi:NADPH-dependent 2,4-dienoyl-CoA reductase/sulfur reductase-like enzyme
MGRVCDADTGAHILAEHARRGVDIRLNTSVVAAAPVNGQITLTTSRGDTLRADTAVVGTGVVPDDALASAAGLKVQDGIVVDEQCRTSDPAIFAAGDVTCFPGPRGLVRLENWRGRQRSLPAGAVVLDRAVRSLHPGRGLAVSRRPARTAADAGQRLAHAGDRGAVSVICHRD